MQRRVQNHREVHESFLFPLEIGATKTLMCSYVQTSPSSISHSWQDCLNWRCSQSLTQKPHSSSYSCSNLFVLFPLSFLQFFGFTPPGVKKITLELLSYFRSATFALWFSLHTLLLRLNRTVSAGRWRWMVQIPGFCSLFTAPVQMINIYNHDNNCNQIINHSHINNRNKITAHGARSNLKTRKSITW